jgi:TM2 domain-containing membrane protein YozV
VGGPSRSQRNTQRETQPTHWGNNFVASAERRQREVGTAMSSFCKDCGKPLPPYSEFDVCWQHGGPPPSNAIDRCPVCRKPILADSTKCRFCGELLKMEVLLSPPPSTPNVMPPQTCTSSSVDQYEIALLNRLTPEQRSFFQAEFNATKKSETTGVVLALFLGGVGAHHFYMRRPVLGATYALLFWTFIPTVISFIECFLMPSQVRNWNDRKALEIVQKASLLHS